jgi:hypothetical protein
MKAFISILLLMSIYHICSAGVVHVPGDEPTIQAGINAASEGDTVLVAPGTYIGDGNRDIGFGSKNLVLKSEAGPELTIIDNEMLHLHRIFYFTGGEDTTAVVEGFTITNGNSGMAGGGIACWNSSPTIRGNIIQANRSGNLWPAPGNGGGIFLFESHAQIIGNRIIRNGSGGDFGGVGGGISVIKSSPTIRDNIIAGNATSTGDMGNNSGTGIYMFESNGLISGNSFLRNSSYPYGTALSLENSQPIIERCLFAYNKTYPCWSNSLNLQNPITCCLSYGNATTDYLPGVDFEDDTLGNLCIDPGFCDTINYNLYPHSPCLPENNECRVLIGAQGAGECDYRAIINIDRSGSMGITNQVGQSRFERARQLAHDDIDKIISEYDLDYPGVHETAVMCFNTTGGIDLIQDFTTDTTLLHDAVDAIPSPKHDTPLAAALCQAHCNLNDLDSIPGYVFTYTDGRENNSQEFEICALCQPCNQYMNTGWNYDCDPDNPVTCTVWQMCLYNQFIENNMNVIHYFGEPIDPHVKSADLEDFYFLNSAANNSSGLFIYHSDLEILDYLCGDVNYDGDTNVSDAVYIINYIFSGGNQPNPYASADVNCDENVNVSDAVWIINYVFIGGNNPCDTNGDGNPNC